MRRSEKKQLKGADIAVLIQAAGRFPAGSWKALRCSHVFTLSCKVICPTGADSEFLSSGLAKNKLLFK